jgi:hypothetical protein
VDARQNSDAAANRLGEAARRASTTPGSRRSCSKEPSSELLGPSGPWTADPRLLSAMHNRLARDSAARSRGSSGWRRSLPKGRGAKPLPDHNLDGEFLRHAIKHTDYETAVRDAGRDRSGCGGREGSCQPWVRPRLRVVRAANRSEMTHERTLTPRRRGCVNRRSWLGRRRPRGSPRPNTS